MGSDDRREVFGLFCELVLRADYRPDSQRAHTGKTETRESIEAALGEALSLFIDRPDYGFVFVALENERAVACASISYAISLSLGRVVAQLQHLIVTAERRRQGIASALLDALIEHLRLLEIARLDVEVQAGDATTKALYLDFGFAPAYEERFALVL